ncbi:WXG100 family type VII secretion target [Streptomyces sp. NBC_01353]|uniref:WXG100 family type VII secretion target n=1 Tax=Streptomyces sp. NBC_01353 TaxID=2903835 RepID=UPI002E343F89|nr:hypothetical protein [Streptomyces sp. NBC_01353]
MAIDAHLKVSEDDLTRPADDLDEMQRHLDGQVRRMDGIVDRIEAGWKGDTGKAHRALPRRAHRTASPPHRPHRPHRPRTGRPGAARPV